ncbi:MAG: transglycosylase SLT domain-containing protein [Chitinispirillaceae bacterium]|nr:transglycosylase SLT domain-containing protein [Chitinispirillaceae bacterium]
MSGLPPIAAALLLMLTVYCNKPPHEPKFEAEGNAISNSMRKRPDSSANSIETAVSQASPLRKKERGKKGRILQSALSNRRFNPQKWLDDDRSFPPPGPPGKISYYDPLIKRMSRRYGFDWRLIAAQIYAESRFDSAAQSRCGALGLMQIMPKTAKHLGADPLRLDIPEVNIATGCLYDRKMVSLWKKDVDHYEERLAFALASYNAGRGRVLKSFSRPDSLTEWKSVHPLLPGETQDYVHRIALKHDFYCRHALP